MTISSINSSSSVMLGGMKNMQRPDASKMAEDLFSKLDTSGKGYIEKSDLASALSNISGSSSSSSSAADEMFTKLDSNGNGKVTQEEVSATLEKIASQLDGPFPRMRLQEGQNSQGGQGEMPPPPPPQEGNQNPQSTSSTDSSSSSQSSDPADTNGDGTVSVKEALAYAEKQLSSANDSSSTTNPDAQLMQMLGGMPPPPKNGIPDDQGFTKDQLTSMSKELSSTDSQRSQVMSHIASNFDAADTNGDGKVSGSEARAFEESKSSSSSDSNSNSSSTVASNTSDAQFMKQMMDLLHAYSGFDQSTESNRISTSA
ncbi:MAG: EF-hand domain-containing protein [Methylovulum sp.]|nr:MAG: EF-hand domain-containing protein [Methylovulum sp.]